MAETLSETNRYGNNSVGFGTEATSAKRAVIWNNNPLLMFLKTSTQGGYYAPSPSTCFQDTAGATPAAVGQPVGRLNDLSGNGNHLLQATAGFRPLLQQSGSLYYLDFDGVDDVLVMTASATWDSMAVAAGFRPIKVDTISLEVDTTTGNTSLFRYVDNNNLLFSTGNANSQAATTGLPTNGTDAIIGMNVDAPNNTATAFLNGQVTALAPAGGASTGTFKRITLGGNGGIASASCRIYSLIVLGRKANDFEMASMLQYAARLAGV